MAVDLLAFNNEALTELEELEAAGESGLISDLINDYTANSRELLDIISTASATDDFPLLERSAHTLKSSSSLLGLEILAKESLIVENAARQKTHAPEAIATLKPELEKALNELNIYCLSRNRNNK